MKNFTLSLDQFIAINSLSNARQREIYKALIDFFFTGKTLPLSKVAEVIISFYKTHLNQILTEDNKENTLYKNKVDKLLQLNYQNDDETYKRKEKEKKKKEGEEKERSKEKEDQEINKKNKNKIKLSAHDRECACAREEDNKIQVFEELDNLTNFVSDLKTSNKDSILNSISTVQTEETSKTLESISKTKTSACDTKKLSISEPVKEPLNPFTKLSDSLSNLKKSLQDKNISTEQEDNKSTSSTNTLYNLENNSSVFLKAVQNIKKLHDLEKSKKLLKNTNLSKNDSDESKNNENDFKQCLYQMDEKDDSNPIKTLKNDIQIAESQDNSKKIFETQQIINSWNEIANKYGRAKIRTCPPDLLRSIKARVQEQKITLEEFFSVADKALSLDSHLRNGTENWSGANLDFFARPKNFRRCLEIIENPPQYKKRNSGDLILKYEDCPL
nr:MAG TPA: hypothetical protein [Caudoviricetes sp.]